MHPKPIPQTSNLAERRPTTGEYISTCLDNNITISQSVLAVPRLPVISIQPELSGALFWVDGSSAWIPGRLVVDTCRAPR
jgi:hypothetical protein